MRTWNEIKGFMITDSGGNLLIRYHIFDKDGEKFKGADIILGPDEIWELYNILSDKIVKENNAKKCLWCTYNDGGICFHPDGAQGENECRRENKKYFKPRVQI